MLKQLGSALAGLASALSLATSASAAGSSTADGGNVAQHACGQTSSQWVLDSTADGFYRLVNRTSNKALDVADCGTADWSNVDQMAWTGSNCQQFRLQPIGQVAITSKQSGKVLDVANCSTANGADVRQWPWGNVACQRWTFTHTDNGWYRIAPASAASSCLIVAGGSTADGANVEQGACTGNRSQWRLEPLADGSTRLVPRNSGKALDLANCGLPDGANIVQWSWLDNICQRFYLRPV